LFIGGKNVSDKKIKLLTISDHPLLPSGVGLQTKYMIEALLQSGKFQVLSLGGAVKHPDYSPTRTEDYGEDWVIVPVDGYANPEQLRSHVLGWKPDIIYFMTDPRFYEWLWQMEDEIRENVPLVYYHVWDNYPYPTFNDRYYESNDLIVSISKVTSDIVQTVSPSVPEIYHPHAVDTCFRKFKTPSEKALVRNARRAQNLEDKFVFFWNSRNARRKQSGSLLFWYKDFLDRVGHDKACLVMHTEINDPHGQPLQFIAEHLGLSDKNILFSQEKIPTPQMAILYNMADCTIAVSDAEGFGLSAMESLACGTPMIATLTGGLQEQVTDGENTFGVGLEPASKAIIGSLQVPWIYEDRLNGKDVVDAMVKMFEMSKEDREKLGDLAIEHITKNYNFKNYGDKWVEIMTNVYEKHGSWETRKNYNNRWEFSEI
tara:strand:+ start:309 stop:1595 length:1287 start_codon:yes stop_codon:yes gene_type:complete